MYVIEGCNNDWSDLKYFDFECWIVCLVKLYLDMSVIRTEYGSSVGVKLAYMFGVMKKFLNLILGEIYWIKSGNIEYLVE